MSPGQKAFSRPIATVLGLFVAFATASTALPASAAPGVIQVDSTADRPVTADCDDSFLETTLRKALCLAGDDDEVVVQVPAGTYTLSAGALVVDPGDTLDLTILGAGETLTTIDARRASRVLDVDPSLSGGVRLTVAGVTLTGGVGTPGTGGGGAILAGTGDPSAPDALTLRDCAITDSTSVATESAGTPLDVGGAVSMSGGELRVENCRFVNNAAYRAPGGAIGYTGVGGADSVTVTGSTFLGNRVPGPDMTTGLGGGAVDVAWGSPTTAITGSRFVGNEVLAGSRAAQGSAVRVTSGTATLEGVSVLTNSAVGGPGSTAAVHLVAGTVADSRFVGNTTTTGGTTTRQGLVGASSAVRSWWGCSDLTTATCDSAGGAATAPHAVAVTTLDPSAASAGDPVTALVTLALSDGTAARPSLLAATAGAPVTWAGADFTATTDAVSGDGTATATLTAGASTTVTSTVDGDASSAVLDVVAPATISTPPADVSALEGTDATFTAAASGTPAPTLQWQRRAGSSDAWADVAGATGTTLDLLDVTRAQNGTQVRLVATNSGGVATSAPATLTVTWGPEDVVGPQDVAMLAGETATFTASASGRPAPTWQWQTSTDGTTWQDEPGAITATFTRTLSAQDDGLEVRAVATGATGEVATAPARVTIESAPAFTTQPADTTVPQGDLPRFTVAVSGTPAPAVTWQTRAPGASTWTDAGTGLELVLDEATPAQDGTRVRAVATSARGTATSDEATLRVQHGPTFTQQPAAPTVDAGQDVTFTAAAAGFPAPVLQWQTSTDGQAWTSVSGATGGSWTWPTTSADDGRQVRVVASGFTGTSVSQVVTLAVRYAPTVSDPADATADAGDDATFSVSVTGNPAPTVRWEQRAAGASTWTDAGTGTTLTLTDLTANDDQTVVRAVVTNALGTVTSADATLTVRYAPAFTQEPQDVTGLADEDVTFTAAATGNPAPTVVWQTSTDGTTWTDVPGADAWTYVRTLADGDDGLQVRAVATNDLATIASAAALVTVEAAPTVTDPADTTVDAGDDATFSVSVTGNPAPTVRWEQRAAGASTWTDAGTGTTLTLTDLTAEDDQTVVRAVVTNALGTVTSADATLTVRYAPAFTQEPQDVTGLADEDVTFTAAATGNPAPAVVWQTSTDGSTWIDVPGADAWTYVRTLADGDDGLQVRAVATNDLATVASAAALVTVDAVPTLTDPADVTADAGTPATFEVTVTGRPAPQLTWQRSDDGATWVDVAGATGPTLVVDATPDVDGTRYRAVAANPRGTVTSAPATLRVLTAPTVTDPQDVATTPGTEAVFTVDVTGSPLPDVTWEGTTDGLTWTPVGTGTELRLTPTLADDGLRVRAVATSTLVAGPVTVTSAEAELTVADVPVVLDGPGPLTQVRVGVPTSLTWTVRSADATPTWEVSRDGGVTWTAPPVGWNVSADAGGTGVLAAGPAVTTEHTLALTPTAADEGAIVRLTVTNPVGSVVGSTVLDVLAVDVPGPGGPGTGGPGTGGPGAGDPGTGGPGTGGPGTGGPGTGTPGAGGTGGTGGSGGTTPVTGLPRTGTDALGLLALAALLAAAGVGAVAAGARRRRTAR